MNNKSTPDQMRILLRRMRGEKFNVNEVSEPKKNLSIRDMLKITRNINEALGDQTQEEKPENKETFEDQKREEEKLLARLQNPDEEIPTVTVDFGDLIVTDKFVFFAGTVNGVIQFAYSVSRDNSKSRVKFNYLEGFNPDDEENKRIIEQLEIYYREFASWWLDNVLQKVGD